jgi:hypothetical protein
MPALVFASQVYPTCEAQKLCNSGKPELHCIHVFTSVPRFKTWIAGTSPAMTSKKQARHIAHEKIQQENLLMQPRAH